MAILGVDHINIGTDRLEETCAFFCEVLGLTVGWRPDFDFGGAWLYSGDQAIVHLVQLDKPKLPSAEGALDHFAFRIDDYEGVRQRLEQADIRHRAIDAPGGSAKQIFLRDPNGVTIELNYAGPR